VELTQIKDEAMDKEKLVELPALAKMNTSGVAKVEQAAEKLHEEMYAFWKWLKIRGSNKMTPETTKTLQNLKTCASTWETDVRLLGNVQAGEIVKAITEVLDQKENITPRPKPDPLCPECNQPASQQPTTLNMVRNVIWPTEDEGGDN